jgi:hypothetical protein
MDQPETERQVMASTRPNDPETTPPDRNSTPLPIPVGPSQDFIMGVYTQLSQMQRDLGSIATAQKMLTEQVQASEVRISASIKDAEERTVKRLGSAEDKLSSLKDRVNRVLWMGAGVGLVVGVLVGWKPIFTHISALTSDRTADVSQSASKSIKQ